MARTDCVRDQSVHTAGGRGRGRGLLRRPLVAPLSRFTRPHRNPVRSYSDLPPIQVLRLPLMEIPFQSHGRRSEKMALPPASSSSSSAPGGGVSADQDCEAGLRCAGCDGDLGVCVSIRPYVPRSKVGDLPFNKYSWQTTHNSFADAGAHSATGATLITFTNQQYDITSQLNNVRFFALSHVHLCFRIFFPRRGLYASPELSAS
ncbi:PI-PLC X domain-containing protein [Musa troglodytarum]|uniref:PI-PLC X domain-containing protein n=1 Tax=Musa troglodytarum TaxID=320322 RepID=A0A9E7HW60_9LILI|nr:PI-PLC X domain-containing protein [Musa troglodytarum]